MNFTPAEIVELVLQRDRLDRLVREALRSGRMSLDWETRAGKVMDHDY